MNNDKSVNVDTMRGREGEVVEMAASRHIDFCCLQETGWKGEGARKLGGYKFFWMGREEGYHGVGVLVAEEWIEQVSDVKRWSERIMVMRVVVGRSVVNLVSVYAPQSGRGKEEKEEFFTVLGKILSDIDVGERLLICGDMNGTEVDGFEGVHVGYGFGRRNVEGEMLLEFADALDFAIVNTRFKKEVRKMITYETKACKTVIDFFLIRKSERKLVRDVKVVHEECITQHKLLICAKLTGQPSYISDLLHPYQPVRSLRSSIQNRLEIPFVKTVFASRAFSVAAPQIWNKLPDHIKSSDTISKFGKQLKTFLFGQAYPAA